MPGLRTVSLGVWRLDHASFGVWGLDLRTLSQSLNWMDLKRTHDYSFSGDGI